MGIGTNEIDKNFAKGPLPECQQSKLAVATAAAADKTREADDPIEYYAQPSCRNFTDLLLFTEFGFGLRSIPNTFGPIKQAIQVGLILSFMRLMAYSFCRVELTKPGSQWITGFWAGVAFIRALTQTNNLIAALAHLDPATGKPAPYKYFNKHMLNPYRGPYAEVAPIIHPYSTSLNADINPLAVAGSLKKLCMYSALFNFLCPFISTEAFCTDCTTIAYSRTHWRKYESMKGRV